MNDILDVCVARRMLDGVTLRALVRLLAAHPMVGAGVALVLRSERGAAPWEVFHVGLARATGLSVGAATSTTAVAVGHVLGGRAGPGTLFYAAAIGPAAQWSIQLFAKESACHPSI
jgi:uncharacterized membrane protein YczE